MSACTHGNGRTTPEQMARSHVYVVNGSPEFLNVIREFLQAERYNVTTTNFVPRTFEMIEAAAPTLIVVDLVMGEKAGWDLLVRLRRAASTRDIPLILISTTPTLIHEARDRHWEFGGDAYLLKPFDLYDLLLLTEELIGET